MQSMLTHLITFIRRRIPREPEPMPRMRWYN
jgi:hypothetical protein